MEPEFHEQILPAAISLAEAQPVGAFRRKLRALIETVRATTLAERHEEAVQRRRVVLQPDHDAMTWVMTLMPAVEAQAIWGRATRMAKVILASEGETRTLDQIRADVIADLLIEGDTALHPAEARGIRATVAVTVPVLALLDRVPDGVEPAVVEGIGPIPVDRARELAGGADGWTRILTHPETGMVLSVGRDQYGAPPGLRRLVQWRADRCMAPGCGIPASRCEIDHRVAWEHGGETQTREPESALQGASHRQAPRRMDRSRRRRELRRGRVDLSHRPALRRSARATSTRVPGAARMRPAPLLTREAR